jgi:hypothetical protein
MAWLLALALLLGLGSAAYLLWLIVCTGTPPGYIPPVDPVSIPAPGTIVLIIVGLLTFLIWMSIDDEGN